MSSEGFARFACSVKIFVISSQTCTNTWEGRVNGNRKIFPIPLGSVESLQICIAPTWQPHLHRGKGRQTESLSDWSWDSLRPAVVSVECKNSWWEVGKSCRQAVPLFMKPLIYQSNRQSFFLSLGPSAFFLIHISYSASGGFHTPSRGCVLELQAKRDFNNGIWVQA